MALQLNYVTDSGLTVTNAYYRIIRFQGYTVGKPLDVDIAVHKDLASRQAGVPAVATIRFIVPYDEEHAQTALAYLYEGLKALPAFAGALDI